LFYNSKLTIIMHLFYYPEIKGDSFILNKEESSHCVRVLRLSANDTIHLTNGKGKLYKACIIKPGKHECILSIMEVTEIPKERNYNLSIAIAPTKNIERFEWFIEKSTEIGVDRIIPLLCKNSERKVIKEERLRKVMVSAMKQSLKAWLPEIEPLTSYTEIIHRQFSGNRFIATGSEPWENHLGRLYDKGADAMILIGPEGDFHESEMSLAIHNSFKPVSLGKSRLRTETAGLVACHTINFINSSDYPGSWEVHPNNL
jgi:16S rRNA (uracil1498-N3)-methyltransferase